MRLILRILCPVFLLVPCLSGAGANLFVVTSNADSGPGTLRDALTQAAANGSAVTDSISFNIPDLSFAGRIIDLQTELPGLSSNLVIDGSTQPGAPFAVTDAKVFIRKLDYAPSFSLLKAYNCSNVRIYGLYLYYGDWQSLLRASPARGPALYGVDLLNAFHVEIGAPGKGNVINGVNDGIHAGDNNDSCRDIVIRSNYINLGLYYTDGVTPDIDGDVLEGEIGLALANVKDCTIGGPTPADGNTISGHLGIILASRYQTGNGSILIQNNHFSRAFDKTTLQNPGFWDTYVHVGVQRYVLLGNLAAAMDYSIQILDNDIPATLELDHIGPYFTIQRNHFWANPINVDFKALFTECEGGGMIGGDDPANANYFQFGSYNGYSVHVYDCGPVTNIKNIYECNSTYGSTTWNQYTYNFYQAPFVQIGQTTAGSVSGKADPNCRIDLYYDDECTACEGKIYIGKVNSDASGNWSYSGPVNGTVVATATDALGRTGDFSAPRFFTGGMKVVQPSCGRANGSITGITSDGAESYYWINDQTGAVVGNSIDLTNVGPGEYHIFGVHGGTCINPMGNPVELGDLTPALLLNYVFVTQPGCGKSNGSISNIIVNETVNLKYSWINAQRQEVADQPTLTNAPPGQYKLIIQDTVSGCGDSTGFYDLINQAGPTVDISAVRITGTTCHLANGAIGNIQFGNITGQANYSWLDSTGNIVGTSPSLDQVPAGNYRLKFNDQSSCDPIVTPVLPIGNTGGDPRLTASGITVKQESCERRDASAQIEGIVPSVAGFDLSWTDSLSQQVIGTGLSISQVGAGKYYFWAMDAGGCRQLVDSVRLIDDPAPLIATANAVMTPDICSQQEAAITGISVTGSAPFAYAWYDAGGDQLSQTKDLTKVGTGSFHLVVTDNNNCMTTSPVLTVGDSTLSLDAPRYDDLTVIRNARATLKVKDPAAGNYALYPMAATGGPAAAAAQQNTSGDFSTGAIGRDTTVYVVFRIGDCVSAPAPVKIQVLQTLELIVPNAFTPNGDGANDVFRIRNPGLIRTFAMTVFNRWGQKVFETTDPFQGWDGSLGGRLQNSGNYVWKIHYTDIVGNSADKGGVVLLIR